MASAKQQRASQPAVAVAREVGPAPAFEQGAEAYGRFESALPEGPTLTAAARALCDEAGFTNALLDRLMIEAETFAHRFFILDNSGSMSMPDGAYWQGDGMRACSRWKELGQSLQFISSFADAAGVPSSYALLNQPASGKQFFDIGSQIAPPDEIFAFRDALRSSPLGGTPLVQHVRRVNLLVRESLPILQHLRKRAMIVIFTDGLPSDGGGSSEVFLAALRELQGLPVHLVIRLCTDESAVVEFWNNVDKDLENIPVDILDDLQGEAHEVARCQPWLTYGMPLHRLREFGAGSGLWDLLDERAFTKDESAEFLELIFGELPDPYGPDYLRTLESRIRTAGKVVHPLRRRKKPWVDLYAYKVSQGYASGLIRTALKFLLIAFVAFSVKLIMDNIEVSMT